MKYSVKDLLIFLSAAAFIIWFCRTAYLGLTNVETGENVPAVSWLPDSASNVSYYRSYSYTAYEFDISEAEFKKWSRWEVSPIAESFGVSRFNCMTLEIPEPGPNAAEDEIMAYLEGYASRTTRVTNGLYYEYVQDNGGGVAVAYDRDKGRAYYQSSPR